MGIYRSTRERSTFECLEMAVVLDGQGLGAWFRVPEHLSRVCGFPVWAP